MLGIYEFLLVESHDLKRQTQNQGRGESVNWGGGVYIHIFVLCPTNFF